MANIKESKLQDNQPSSPVVTKDISEAGQEVEISGNTYHVNGHSAVVLLSR